MPAGGSPAGIVVTLAGLVVAALIVHLQVGERAAASGTDQDDAAVIVEPTGNRRALHHCRRCRSCKYPSPTGVNPGTQRDGESVEILYRPDRPTDVLIVESTTARDITLWVVALKMLVGGPVFLGVGIRRLRQARAATA